ncbi:secreted RxLR effector protein 161-like [Nicotiana sylvestris]|uniref:secreted RxLR effector protein 161-like n=1 Tax=Nicotiana sylvestris TaxID=4096 RepID=UPI00388CACEA
MVQIYADGIIFGATTDLLCEEFAKLMRSEFEMSMLEELNVLLGLQVKQSIKRTCISQQKCIKELLKRSDIVFSVGLCARFQSNSKESHLKAAKRILRYFKGTQNLVLYYSSGDNFNLIGYADADYAGYLVNKKSTSGMAHFLRSWIISWGTRKQNLVALSTAEAEYVAAVSCSITVDQATIGRFWCIH